MFDDGSTENDLEIVCRYGDDVRKRADGFVDVQPLVVDERGRVDRTSDYHDFLTKITAATIINTI